MSAMPFRTTPAIRPVPALACLALLVLCAAPLAAQQPASVLSLLDTGGRSLAPGQEVEGHLGEADLLAMGRRVQAWTLEGRPGQAIRVDMEADDFDAYLAVVGPGLGEVTDDDGGAGTNARLCIELPESGTYRVVAASYSGGTGAFRLRAEQWESCAALPAGPTAGDVMEVPAAGSVEVGSAVTGRLGSGVRFEGRPAQRWTLEGRAGQRLAIRQTSAGLDSYLYLAGPGFPNPLSSDDVDGTLDSRICVALPESGTYQVVAAGLDASHVGEYRLSVTPDPDGEICDDFMIAIGAELGGLPLEGQPLDVGSDVAGELDPATDARHPGDGSLVDLYGLEVAAGETRVVDLVSDDFDAYMYVVGPGLAELLVDDDSGGRCNARIRLRAPETGTYRVIVNSLADNGAGAYTLRVAREAGPVAEGECDLFGPGYAGPAAMEVPAGFVEHVRPEAGRELPVGVEVDGTLSATDPALEDGSFAQAWSLQARAGETLVVELLSDDFDAFLLVAGPGLEDVMADDDGAGGTNARVTFTAPATGAYRVIVSSFGAGAEGGFRLRTIRRLNGEQ